MGTAFLATNPKVPKKIKEDRKLSNTKSQNKCKKNACGTSSTLPELWVGNEKEREDLELCCILISYCILHFVGKIGFNTAESEPSKVIFLFFRIL